MYKYISLIALTASIASVSAAQEIPLNGAIVEGDYRSYTDEDLDFQALALKAGADIVLGSNFALGANFANYSSSGDNSSDATGTNFTLHGMYLMSPSTAVGAFYTTETFDNEDVAITGIEFSTVSESSRFEAYYGVTDLQNLDEDITISGLSFEFTTRNGLILGLEYDSYGPDIGTVAGTFEQIETRISDTSLFAGFDAGNGMHVKASIGQLSETAVEDGVSYSSQDPLEYIGLSAGFSFGANGAPLMSERTYIGFGG